MTLKQRSKKIFRTGARRMMLTLVNILGRRKLDKEGMILTYHSIDDSGSRNSIYPDVFQWQMNYIRDCGFRCVSLGDYLDARKAADGSSAKLIALTFDDGYRNFLESAAPILEQLGFGATVFVVAGRVGDVNAWEMMAGIPTAPLMDQDQLIKCLEAGFEIGAHSMTHPHLSTMDNDDQHHEVFESRAQLKAMLDRDIETFCYPYGDYNDDVQRCVERAGYRAAVTSELAYHREGDALLTLPRIGMNRVSSDDFAAQCMYLKMALNGALPLYNRIKQWSTA